MEPDILKFALSRIEDKLRIGHNHRIKCFSKIFLIKHSIKSPNSTNFQDHIAIFIFLLATSH